MDDVKDDGYAFDHLHIVAVPKINETVTRATQHSQTMTWPDPEQLRFVRVQLEMIGRHPVANFHDAVLKS